MSNLVLAVVLAAVSPAVAAGPTLPQDSAKQDPLPTNHEELRQLLADDGIVLDLERREVRVRGEVLRRAPSREFLIDYALVTEGGNAYESLGSIQCTPSLLNAALLALGLNPGRGCRPVLRDPLPSEEDIEDGLEDPYRWLPPEGDRVFLYLKWSREDGTEVVRPVEALLRDLATGDPLPMRGFVYVGSRFGEADFGTERRSVFLADYLGNTAAIHPSGGRGEVCLFDVYAADAEMYENVDVDPADLPPPDRALEFVFTPLHQPGTRPVDIGEPHPEAVLLPASQLREKTRNRFLSEADEGWLDRLGSRTLPELAGILKRSRRVEARSLAAALIGAAGCEEGAGVLFRGLCTDHEADVRRSCAIALAEIGTPGASRFLVRALERLAASHSADVLAGLCLLSTQNLGTDVEAWRTWWCQRYGSSWSSGDASDGSRGDSAEGTDDPELGQRSGSGRHDSGNVAASHALRPLPGVVSQEGETPTQGKEQEASETDANSQEVVVELSPVVVKEPEAFTYDGEPVWGETLPGSLLVERRQVRVLPDAVKESPGVGLQRTGHGQASPYLHGFTGFRTLFVLDGFRFNNAAWRDGPNQYFATLDAELIDTLDLFFNTGAVRYGPDAVGGTIVLESKPAGPAEPGRDHTGLVAFRAASAERSLSSHVEAGGRLGNVADYRVGFTRRSFGDLDGGRHVGEQGGTGYDTAAADVKLTFPVAERSDLTLAYQRDRQIDVPRTHKTLDGISWHGTTIGTERKRDLDQDRDLLYLRLDWQEDGFFDRVQAGLAYHSQEERQFRVRGDGRSDRSGFDVDTVGFTLSFQNDTTLGRLRYGLDLYHDDVDSFRRDFNDDGSLKGVRIQGPVGDDSNYDLFGLYLEDRIGLSARDELSLGGRWSWARADSDKVEDPGTGTLTSVKDEWSDVALEARLLHHFSDGLEGWVGASQSVRMPNLTDLTRFSSNRTGEIQTPSPGLDPEHFTTAELGVRYSGDRLTVGLAGHATLIRGMIVRHLTGRVVDGLNEVAKSNVGDGTLHGADLMLGYRLNEAWSLGADLSYVAGRVDTLLDSGTVSPEPITKVPPPFSGHLRARWDDPESTVWMEGVLTAASEQDRLAPRDETDTERIPPGGTPGFAVYTVRAGFQPLDRLTVSAAIENITNRDYRLHGSGVNEPGTNFVLSVRWRF